MLIPPEEVSRPSFLCSDHYSSHNSSHGRVELSALTHRVTLLCPCPENSIHDLNNQIVS